MRLRRQLVAVTIAAVAMIGSAQAQTTPGQTFNLGILSSTPKVTTDAAFTGGASFADIFNFTVGGGNHTVLASAFGAASDGTPTLGAVSNLTLELFAGSGATGSALDTRLSSDGSLIDLSKVLAAGDFSARVTGLVNGGGGFQFSIASNPEPAEWMMLLAGLVVVGFMARRKASLVTG